MATEGTYSGCIEDTIVLVGSSVRFKLTPLTTIKARVEDLDEKCLVRIIGKSVYDEAYKTYHVEVTVLESAQSVMQRVVAELSSPSATPESLYEAGRLARSVSTGRDEKLDALGEAAFVKALKMEDLALDPDDYEGYIRLAEKSWSLLARPKYREFYIREAIAAFINVRGKRKAETYYNASIRAEELLPGEELAGQLLEKGFAVEKGGRSPESAEDYYALAANARDIFGERGRYFELLSKALTVEQRVLSGRDYMAMYDFARKVRETYPDYRDYWSIVTEALMAEKASLDAGDPRAWLRLGNRVLYFLDDKHQAGFYFKEAFRLDSTNQEARDKLRDLGYVYYKGEWWQPDEFARTEVVERAQELETLVSEGKVARGMMTDQVLEAMGPPDEINSSAGGWGHTIQWVYTDAQATTYVVLMADVVISQGRVRRTR